MSALNLQQEREILFRVLSAVRALQQDSGHGYSKRSVITAIKEEFGLGGYEYCNKCGWQPKRNFWKNNSQGRRGLQSYCKVCLELEHHRIDLQKRALAQEPETPAV